MCQRNNRRARSPEAVRQLALFESTSPSNELIWYFVLEADTGKDVSKSFVQHAYFIGYDDNGDAKSKWDIPLIESVRVFSSVDEDKPKTDPVKLPPAGFTGKKQKRGHKENEEET